MYVIDQPGGLYRKNGSQGHVTLGSSQDRKHSFSQYDHLSWWIKVLLFFLRNEDKQASWGCNHDKILQKKNFALHIEVSVILMINGNNAKSTT